ncbi:MAG: MerR family transcriptional regulator [Candidatus Cyclobacteriaceae bacterium M2_1C_046]
MGSYSIKELERLSGIKAHTIRIWEKRYNIISPERTPTNIRYYSDEDLKKIINISTLKKSGIKIGNIANLSNEEIIKKIEELHKLKSSPQIYQDQLLVSMIDLDEGKFEKMLSDLILKNGFEYSITKIIFPFLEKVGTMWLTSNVSPAHEHFLSNFIRQKLIVAIDALPIVEDKYAPKVILFLPENELHELGLLYYHYYLRKRGFRTFYLGQQVPIADIYSLTKSYNPQYLISAIFTRPEEFTIEEFFTQLSSNIPNSDILITGYQLRNYNKNIPSNIKLFRSAEDFNRILPSPQKVR